MIVNNKTMRDTIKALVRSNPELANDDKKLLAAVWYLEGWRDPKLLANLKKYQVRRQSDEPAQDWSRKEL